VKRPVWFKTEKPNRNLKTEPSLFKNKKISMLEPFFFLVKPTLFIEFFSFFICSIVFCLVGAKTGLKKKRVHKPTIKNGLKTFFFWKIETEFLVSVRK